MSDSINTFQKKGRFLSVDGVNFFTIDSGKGEVILLLHGFFTTSYVFRKIVPILSENYRVIAPDLPGLGFSEPMKERYSHRKIAYLLAKLIDSVTDQKVHIVTMDYSSLPVFLLLNEYPEKVKSLSVVSPVFTKRGIYFPVNLIRIPILGTLFSFLINSFLFRFIFKKLFFSTRATLPLEDAEDYRTLLLNGTCRKYFVQMCQSIDFNIHALRDMENGMKKLIGGRQILYADEGRPVNFYEAEQIRAYLRLGMVTRMRTGHFPMEEDPADFSEKILNVIRAFTKKG